jgi:uncharacterized protein YdeI (YjbR/CyaY-like superfamily)
VKPRYFASPKALRAWLARNHARATELWVGFYKKSSGRKSVTWPEVVDEALCFGWIDGVRHGIDAQRYVIRLTPRRKGSNWSAINIGRVEQLTAEGRMTAAGLAAFQRRLDDRSTIYSYEERKAAKLPPAMLEQLRANARAFSDFEARPPWYRRAAAHWITTAKKDETKARRLATLIACSARGAPIPPLAPRRKGNFPA